MIPYHVKSLWRSLLFISLVCFIMPLFYHQQEREFSFSFSGISRSRDVESVHGHHTVSAAIIMKSDAYNIEGNLQITGNLQVDGTLPTSLQEKIQAQRKRNEASILEQDIWNSYECTNYTANTFGIRIGHSIIQYRGSTLLIGGQNTTHVNPTVHEFIPETWNWKLLNHMRHPEDLTFSHICSWGSYIVAYGYTGASSISKDIFLYHYESYPSWVNIATGNAPAHLGMHGCHAEQQKMVVMGGYDVNDDRVDSVQSFSLEPSGDDVEVTYHPGLQYPRSNGIGAFIGDSFVYGFGLEDNGGGIGTHMSSLLRYDIAIEEHHLIDQQPQLPTLMDAQSVSMGSMLYLAGGSIVSTPNTQIFRLEFNSNVSVAYTSTFTMQGETGAPYGHYGSIFLIPHAGVSSLGDIVQYGGGVYDPLMFVSCVISLGV